MPASHPPRRAWPTCSPELSFSESAKDRLWCGLLDYTRELRRLWRGAAGAGKSVPSSELHELQPQTSQWLIGNGLEIIREEPTYSERNNGTNTSAFTSKTCVETWSPGSANLHPHCMHRKGNISAGRDACTRKFPRSFAAEAGVGEGSMVDVSVENGCLRIRPLRAKKYMLHDLLKRVTRKNLHPEIPAGEAVGRETWLSIRGRAA